MLVNISVLKWFDKGYVSPNHSEIVLTFCSSKWKQVEQLSLRNDMRENTYCALLCTEFEARIHSKPRKQKLFEYCVLSFLSFELYSYVRPRMLCCSTKQMSFNIPKCHPKTTLNLMGMVFCCFFSSFV